MRPMTTALAALLLAAAPAWGGDTCTERVQFHQGANSATVEGRIRGYQSVDYVLGARQGQSMNDERAII